MAKSIRAKVKMAARRKKRADGFYAATEAARLERLHARLMGKGKGKAAVEGEEAKDDEDVPMETVTEDGDLPIVEEQPKKISTSAPRDTRREQWRLAKGMAARPKGKGLNKQGTAGARTKAGRPKRRR